MGEMSKHVNIIPILGVGGGRGAVVWGPAHLEISRVLDLPALLPLFHIRK